MNSQCICGSQKPSDNCCLSIISGQQRAKTPEQLMRSRYTAYALGGCGQYLLDSWLPATSMGLSAQQLSKTEQKWTGLAILNKSQRGDTGMVEFKAWYIDSENLQHCLHEKSVFTRQDGRWVYVGAEVS